jgi:hypothetical protein
VCRAVEKRAVRSTAATAASNQQRPASDVA